MKMGRRRRCSSVTYRSRYAPLLAPCRRPILIATKATLFMGQDTISRLATGSTKIRTYGFSFGNLRRNEQLQTRLGLNHRPLVWSSKPLVQVTALVHFWRKCSVGLTEILDLPNQSTATKCLLSSFLVRQMLLRLPHDPQEVALCYPHQ